MSVVDLSIDAACIGRDCTISKVYDPVRCGWLVIHNPGMADEFRCFMADIKIFEAVDLRTEMHERAMMIRGLAMQAHEYGDRINGWTDAVEGESRRDRDI